MKVSPCNTAARRPSLALVLALIAPLALAARPASLPESAIDPALLQIDELGHLGTPLAGALRLADQNGHRFTLGELRGQPAILILSYYGCDGACSTFNRSLALALEGVSRFRIGSDYRVLTVSFDRADTPARAREFIAKAGIPAALQPGWRYAVLENERDISRLTGALGFNFFWSRADQVFLHPNVMIFLTPDGRIARYLYGNHAGPREIELALIEADWNRIANSTNLFDMLSGACYSYSYADGRYRFNPSLLAGLGSLLLGVSAIALGAFIHRRKTGRFTHA